jgi:hypothetical protein
MWKSHIQSLEYQRNYRATHPKKIEYHKLYSKQRQLKFKEEIHQLLGGKCSVCGYIGTALQIDHINGNGTKERNFFGRSSVYMKILEKIKSGSKDYQLLCANCNWEKRFKNNENRK